MTENTTSKCIVCQVRDVNPMIGGLEPIMVNGMLVGRNKSYCSRICLNIDTSIECAFLSREALRRIAEKCHNFGKD